MFTPFAETRPDYQDKLSILAPGRFHAAPTLDGTNFTNGPCRSVYVGTGGTLVGQSADDTSLVTFKNIPNGTWLDYQFLNLSGATTATDLVLIY